MSDWKNEYIKQLSSKELYIFGAGRVGKLLFKLCVERGIKIAGFLVTNSDDNFKELMGVPVTQADNIKGNKSNMSILLGVLERGERRIEKYLKYLGYSDIVQVPKQIMEIDSWEMLRKRSPIIEVTSRVGCRVNCKYCPQKVLYSNYFSSGNKRKPILNYEDYKFYLDKLPQNTIIDFSGFVEPFLNKDSFRMMEYTFERGHLATLFTTLRGLDLETAKKVVKMPFSFVCVHLPDKAGYADIPLTEEYYSVLDLFLDSKKEDGQPFIDSANSQFEVSSDILKYTKNKLKVYIELSDRAGNLDNRDKKLAQSIVEGSMYCERAINLNHNVLLPDGSLVLCCNDFALKHVIGNLRYQSYDDIMQGTVLHGIKKSMCASKNNNIICRKCIYGIKIEKTKNQI